MTTIILGANGKLGAILGSYACRAGLDWRRQARSAPADLMWSGDVDDAAADRIFVEGATLINMIGQSSGTEAALHDINVRFVQDLLAKAAQNGVAHVMLASSAAVYGAGSDTAFTEGDPVRPLTPYGASKAAMEDVAATFAANGNAPAITVLRIGNVAGADALTAAARRHIDAGTQMPLHHFEDGETPLRPYIGPLDLFTAIKNLSAKAPTHLRTLNVVHPQPVTLGEMLDGYKTHVLPNLDWTLSPAPHGTIRQVTLSADKLQHFVKFGKYDDPAGAFAAQVAGYLTP